MTNPDDHTALIAAHVYEGIDHYGGGAGLCHCGWAFAVTDDMDDVAVWADHLAEMLSGHGDLVPSWIALRLGLASFLLGAVLVAIAALVIWQTVYRGGGGL